MTKARDIADSDLEDLVVQNDIEVSGGIFLGGTGSANKLDDYEEGTWTPSFIASGTNPTVSGYLRTAEYTKIGRFVYISFRIETNSVTAQGSGQLRVSGLPFSSVSGNSGSLKVTKVDRFNSGNTPQSGLFLSNYIELIKFNSSDPREDMDTDVDAGNLSTGGFTQRFRAVGWYITND